MFSKSIKLFNAFGIPIKIDLSWLLIFFLVVWSLGGNWFKTQLPEAEASLHWVMGVVGALGLFASILLHELGHALTARRFGIPMEGITLFIFGGVAEMTEEPPSPKAEFWVAVGGPLVSVALAVLFWIVGVVLPLPEAAALVVGYLATINFILLVFNMVPAFPLDGGRVLRSALWHWKGNLKWATRISSRIGGGFGLFLIGWGIFNLLGGNIVSALWSVLIGLFVRNAASMSYQQVLIRRVLEGVPVRRFMTADPKTVAPDITVEELVNDYFYRFHHKLFPVMEEGKLVGCVSLREVRDMDRGEWATRRVRDIMGACDETASIAEDTDSMDALTRMHREGISRLLVRRGDGSLAGILCLRDLMEFLALKIDLEEGDQPLAGALRQVDKKRVEPVVAGR